MDQSLRARSALAKDLNLVASTHTRGLSRAYDSNSRESIVSGLQRHAYIQNKTAHTQKKTAYTQNCRYTKLYIYTQKLHIYKTVPT